MRNYLHLFLLIVVLGGMVLIFLLSKREKTAVIPIPSNVLLTPISTPTPSLTSEESKIIHPPLTNAKNRITKKPFGIYITPATSPVQPERFSGFHTGTDFEIIPDELNQEVPVYAIADGEIVEKQIISGYGGVIIQKCTIENQEVTILYGHLNIGGESPQVGEEIKGGRQIAVLANDKSEYSDYERKHLHVGIYKGTEINYQGYVSSQADLSSWLDIAKYL